MKKISLMIVAVMITSLTFAQKLQENNVPAPVRTAFLEKFPQVKVEKWEKEEGNYEVEFELNDSEQSVLFDAKGNVLETEVEIDLNQLPKNVLEYVNTRYKGMKVKEASKIIDANGVITFEAEIKGADLLFDSNGTFIKEVQN